MGVGLTKIELIQEFKDLYGDKYDYSKVKYISAKTNITIICKEHGEFQQTPSRHKNGRGCQKCSGRGLTKLELIQEFKNNTGSIL